MPEGFFERSISVIPERIFLQLKSIWYEMFQHSVAGIRQYVAPDSLTVVVQLSHNARSGPTNNSSGECCRWMTMIQELPIVN
jgi:hypothetical protein